jgi:hypothetical protein
MEDIKKRMKERIKKGVEKAKRSKPNKHMFSIRTIISILQEKISFRKIGYIYIREKKRMN